MSSNSSDEKFASFKEQLENNLKNGVSDLTNMANDLRLTKSSEISELVLKKLADCKNDELIFLYFKLIDSILTSINVPYNRKLSVNLSNLFKKKYLTMNNSNRQRLIELFETWVERANVAAGGKNNEDDLFNDANNEFLPKETLKNIESFLVKASLLHEKRFLQKQKETSKQSTPKVENLLLITSKLIAFSEKSLDNQYSDELYERLSFIKKIDDILKHNKLDESTLVEMNTQLKNLPEFKKSLDTNVQSTIQNDDRVNKFIEKSKNVKVEDLKELLRDLKDLDIIKTDLQKEKDLEQNQKTILSIWTSDMYQKALINYNSHDKSDSNMNEDDENERTDGISMEMLPDLNLLSNISKDLQYAKLSLPDFLQTNIQTNNFYQWSKYIQLLYRNLPEKCQICGKRFPLTKLNTYGNKNKKRSLLMSESFDTNGTLNSMEDLKKNIEQHMVMHYEAASKASIITKQGIRKIMVNRTWYSSPLSAQRAPSDETENLSEAERDDGLFKKRKPNVFNEEPEAYVVVPKALMSNLNDIECEICRDSIKVSFLENVGEWCMLDCKEQGNGFVHLSCL